MHVTAAAAPRRPRLVGAPPPRPRYPPPARRSHPSRRSLPLALPLVLGFPAQVRGPHRFTARGRDQLIGVLRARFTLTLSSAPRRAGGGPLVHASRALPPALAPSHSSQGARRVPSRSPAICARARFAPALPAVAGRPREPRGLRLAPIHARSHTLSPGSSVTPRARRKNRARAPAGSRADRVARRTRPLREVTAAEPLEGRPAGQAGGGRGAWEPQRGGGSGVGNRHCGPRRLLSPRHASAKRSTPARGAGGTRAGAPWPPRPPRYWRWRALPFPGSRGRGGIGGGDQREPEP